MQGAAEVEDTPGAMPTSTRGLVFTSPAVPSFWAREGFLYSMREEGEEVDPRAASHATLDRPTSPA